MSIFKRAFLYVTRKRGKTILLFAILLIMATFVLTGLSIWKASEAAQLDLRQSLGGKFDVFVDWSSSPYVVKEAVKDEVDEETGKTSNSFLMYSTVQFTPENIAAIKGVPGVTWTFTPLSTAPTTAPPETPPMTTLPPPSMWCSIIPSISMSTICGSTNGTRPRLGSCRDRSPHPCSVC